MLSWGTLALLEGQRFTFFSIGTAGYISLASAWRPSRATFTCVCSRCQTVFHKVKVLTKQENTKYLLGAEKSGSQMSTKSHCVKSVERHD